MIKIFYIYLIKRSLYFSFAILMFFGLLDSIFNFISELENLTPDFNIAQILIYVMSSLPHNLIDFIESIEGPVGLSKCSIDSDCDLLDMCNIKQPINKINTNIRNTLSKISLYELTL